MFKKPLSSAQAVNSGVHWSKKSIKSNTIRTDLWPSSCLEQHENNWNTEDPGEADSTFHWDDGCYMYGAQLEHLMARNGDSNSNSSNPRLQKLRLITASEIKV